MKKEIIILLDKLIEVGYELESNIVSADKFGLPRQPIYNTRAKAKRVLNKLSALDFDMNELDYYDDLDAERKDHLEYIWQFI